MSRVVRPEVDVLKISRGDTLTVKSRLNAGEQTDAFDRVAIVNADGTRRVDQAKLGYSLVLAYLVDWTVTDDDGRLLDIRDKSADVVMSMLRALEPDSYLEIIKAVGDHDTAMRVKHQNLKNVQDGANELPAISPSPESLAGVTTG